MFEYFLNTMRFGSRKKLGIPSVNNCVGPLLTVADNPLDRRTDIDQQITESNWR